MGIAEGLYWLQHFCRIIYRKKGPFPSHSSSTSGPVNAPRPYPTIEAKTGVKAGDKTAVAKSETATALILETQTGTLS